MKLRSIVPRLCLIASIASLVLGYGPTVDWPALIAVSAALLLWTLLRRRPARWTASALLSAYLVLAVRGLTLHRPGFLLILGSITALVWWDLADFEDHDEASLRTEADSSLQKYRLQSLAITATSSTVLVVVGLWLRVHLPFGVITLLVVVITAGLAYAVRLLQKNADSSEPRIRSTK